MIVVAGMFAGEPGHGGATWAALQYALGLRRLGHQVLVVEQVPVHKHAAIEYFHRVMAEFDLKDCSAMITAASRDSVGLPYHRVRELTRTAEVLLDISGMLAGSELIEHIPVRVYMDLDPGFNQLWHESGINMRFDGHTHFVTLGQAIGTAGCKVPTHGRSWVPTLPPVVLDEWRPANGIATDALTTVGNFRSYGSIERDGVHYGQKVHSLRLLMGLPRRTDERFALALAVHSDEQQDLVALAANGWELIDPAAAAGTPDAYRDFVRGSRGEIGIAKSGYVVSRCGWFSDRSACYLASGRPVVAQDTGFSKFLPVGEGLLAFDDEDGAVEAVEELRRDYPRHARAARRIAEEYFDSDRILTTLLERVVT